MTITIALRTSEKFPALRADVTIRTAEGIVLRSLQVLESKTGQLWVSVPQRAFDGKQGRGYFKHVLLPEVVQQEVITKYAEALQQPA